jgi:hypothetical protein
LALLVLFFSVEVSPKKALFISISSGYFILTLVFFIGMLYPEEK